MNGDAAPLLAEHDPLPTRIINPGGTSSFLLIGDHAGNAVPAGLASLGLDRVALARHIGWDIGIAQLGERLSGALDAVFVAQRYSRLVIDCNRNPDAADAVPPVSDTTPIPGNRALTSFDRGRRIAAIHTPYQQAIADEIARRSTAAQPTILIALHSFTPALAGAPDSTPRPWHVGILHDRGETRFACALRDVLARDPALVVGDNEPYRMDRIDYTVPRHAYPARLSYAEIEVRQDLLATPAGCADWSARLAGDLVAAQQACG